MKQISGNKLLVKALKEEGVDVLFGYPGACTIDISDELYKQSGIDIVLPRHEQALVHEADAYARTTGKVGVCLVTSGPGATNLVTGLATANSVSYTHLDVYKRQNSQSNSGDIPGSSVLQWDDCSSKYCRIR